MTDPVCAAPEDGTQFGEQPKGWVKKLATKIGSERPNVEPKSRVRKGGRKTERAGRSHSAPCAVLASTGNCNCRNSRESLAAAALQCVGSLVSDARKNHLPMRSVPPWSEQDSL